MTNTLTNNPDRGSSSGVPEPTSAHLDAVRAVLVDALGNRLSPGIDDDVDLFAADGVLETPFVREGESSEVRGRAAIRDFVASLRGWVVLSDFRLTAVYDAGQTVVLEYRGTVHQPHRDLIFAQSYIAVVRIEHRRITLLREYSDPGRADEVATRAGGGR